jgi:hypothetical protein
MIAAQGGGFKGGRTSQVLGVGGRGRYLRASGSFIPKNKEKIA